MKILTLSDIHGQVSKVARLRKRESNEYDLVLVAGDIVGSMDQDQERKQFAEIIQTLESFECPVYYVFGNWDNRLEYDLKSKSRTKHLHQTIKKFKGYYFAGISGCEAHWGRNPIYLERKRQIEKRHQAALLRYSEIQARLDADIEEIEKDRDRSLQRLKGRIPDSRTKEFKKAEESLSNRFYSKERKARRPLDEFRASLQYKAYRNELSELSAYARDENRKELIDKIREEGVPEEKLILLTHERVSKLKENGITPLLNVFGHNHCHKIVNYNGCHFLNTAALGNSTYSIRDERDGGMVDVYPEEGYCRVTIQRGDIQVERVVTRRIRKRKLY